MNTEINPSSKPSIQDFQAFIGGLLESETEKKIDGIRPLTQGLGLESPKKQEPAPLAPAAAPIAQKPGPIAPREASRVATPHPVYKPQPSLISNQAPRVEVAPPVSAPKEVAETEPVLKKEINTAAAPPPLPTVPLTRRTLSFFLDQVFVGAVWLLSLAITSNLFSGFETGLSLGVLGSLSEPFLFRLAVIQYAVFWMAYLGFSLGFFNRTFGMWVWGIRISYGNEKDENYHLRKLMRIIWSFVFYVSIIPSLVLAFRKNDRNLIDILSGSNLYLPHSGE